MPEEKWRKKACFKRSDSYLPRIIATKAMNYYLWNHGVSGLYRGEVDGKIMITEKKKLENSQSRESEKPIENLRGS